MVDCYDVVLHNVRIIDPVTGMDRVGDIAIAGGKISQIGSSGLEGKARMVVDLEGFTAIPGIVDCHTHLTPLFGGSHGGFHMLAKAGVCTALDLAGPVSDVFSSMRENGSGINVAALESVRPGENVRGNNPSYEELVCCITLALQEGALGIKILGGHFPLTPDASRHAIAAADSLGAYAAWHAGSTVSGNGIDALEELLALSEGHFIHVAHVNSFCRGTLKDPVDEAREAMALLAEHPNAYSESYLSESNGTTFALDEKGELKSLVTARILERHGYPNSAAGVEKALENGFARLFIPRGLETVAITGEDAVRRWRKNGCQGSGGFMVNPAMSRIALCSTKRDNGDFCVDAISTDGGAIPRNTIVSHGLALVELGALTLQDFILKSSYNPARLLGLAGKGHLAPGADADVTILDIHAKSPVMTVVSGEVCMYKGLVTGKQGTIYTTPAGRLKAESYGMSVQVIERVNQPLSFRKA